MEFYLLISSLNATAAIGSIIYLTLEYKNIKEKDRKPLIGSIGFEIAFAIYFAVKYFNEKKKEKEEKEKEKIAIS